MSNRLVIGVTGGIATGKSVVTSMLRKRGAITFSADEASRAILYKNGPVFHDILSAFGSDMLLTSGELDRSRLAALIFEDPAARETLNRITHPQIRKLLWAQISSAYKEFGYRCIIAVEVPLLYEGKLQNKFERIVVIATSEAVQIQRLKHRSGLTANHAEARISAQLPMSQKLDSATHVVINDGGLTELAPQVDRLWYLLTQALNTK